MRLPSGGPAWPSTARLPASEQPAAVLCAPGEPPGSERGREEEESCPAEEGGGPSGASREGSWESWRRLAGESGAPPFCSCWLQGPLFLLLRRPHRHLPSWRVCPGLSRALQRPCVRGHPGELGGGAVTLPIGLGRASRLSWQPNLCSKLPFAVVGGAVCVGREWKLKHKCCGPQCGLRLEKDTRFDKPMVYEPVNPPSNMLRPHCPGGQCP